jgi:hypothetical protein
MFSSNIYKNTQFIYICQAQTSTAICIINTGSGKKDSRYLRRLEKSYQPLAISLLLADSCILPTAFCILSSASGHLFHQILPKNEKSYFTFQNEYSQNLFADKLTEKFSQRRKSFKIRSSSNLQSEIPGFNKRGRLFFCFPSKPPQELIQQPKPELPRFRFIRSILFYGSPQIPKPETLVYLPSKSFNHFIPF